MSRVKYILGSQFARISATQQTTCIAVIDESNNTSIPNNAQWNEFRANWPDRPYYLLQAGGSTYTPADLNIPTDMSDDLNNDGVSFGVIDVNREDQGEGSSDWFTICNVESHYNSASFSGDRDIFLFVDNSGSLEVSDVQTSIELFLSNCENATGGPIDVYAVVNTTEDYVDPFITWNGSLVTTYSELAALA